MGMIGRSLVWLVAGVVLAIVALLATHAWRGSEAYVLRSYEVSPELAVETSAALRAALAGGKDGEPYGQVALSPSGQLLVTAPPSVQHGVEQTLRDIAARKPPPTPSIRFEAWFVTASPGDPNDSPNLAEVEPALRAVKEAKGHVRFDLLEKLVMHVRTGYGGNEIQGQRAALKVNTSLRRDSKDQPVITAQLELRFLQLRLQPGEAYFGNPPTLRAQTELRPGELLVVGQSNLADKSGAERELYYIVRAVL
jgi:hypothetical protein